MGAGLLVRKAIGGKRSYDLPGQGKQSNGPNLSACNEKSSPNLEQKSELKEPFRYTVAIIKERSSSASVAGNEIVSQSHCEVNVDEFSSDVSDFNAEKTRSGTSEDNEGSAAEIQASEELNVQQAKMTEELFKPGHVTRVDNVENKNVGHAKTFGNDQLLNLLNQASDEEIQAVVDKCWKEIEESCKSMFNNRSRKAVDITTGWKVVRLFVSSTFADYHAEREILVKKVVPALREWCEERLIHLIECDLRWGVPKDSTTEATIRTCLGEIDHCSEETDGEPFFLNMLGERYGWIPTSSEISQEIQKEYQWIFPVSITHMEIIHAAYRMHNHNAAFLIRSADFIKDLPPEMTRAFVDNHPLNKVQMEALKDKLRQKFPGQVFNYSCQYDGIDESTGRPKVKLKELENFSDSVLEFFKSAISRSVPEVKQQLSAEEMELSMHNHFIELRGQLVLGRDAEVSTIMEYVQHGTLSDGDNTEGLPPLMLLGSSGSGKSTLMSHCTLQMKKLGWPLFYHFVGAGPGSMVPHKLVEKLVRWLQGFDPAVQPDNLAAGQDMSTDMLKEKMKKALDELAEKQEVFIIVIDAINQLADAEDVKHMDWFPSVFPRNVRCVISAVTGSRSAVLLSSEHRTPPPVPLHVGELNESARQEIVKRNLGKYNKKLDAEQMKLLMASPGASSPLWLSLACEELRVFGVFETITHHIKSLPATIKELLQLIINRLINEDENNNVQKLLGFLACSRGGLSETELQYLLSDNLTEPVPMMMWVEVRRTLKPFLRNTTSVGVEERLEFFHASIQEVVQETILVGYEEKRKCHRKLADFFVDHCKDDDRVIFMVPEQLKQGGEKKRLLEFLRNDNRSKNRPGFWKNNYYKDLRCSKMLHVGTPFAHDVNICQFCSMRRGAFGEMSLLNKDSCFICGRFATWKDDRHAAMACNFHKPPPGPPNMKMCFLCRKPAFQNAWKVYLCPFCGMGMKRCAMLVGE